VGSSVATARVIANYRKCREMVAKYTKRKGKHNGSGHNEMDEVSHPYFQHGSEFG
jgi:hypothetical protein